jgi:hypothetical protein
MIGQELKLGYEAKTGSSFRLIGVTKSSFAAAHHRAQLAQFGLEITSLRLTDGLFRLSTVRVL